MERWVGLEEAARLLDVHPSTLRRREKEGPLHVERTPGGWRKVPESELVRLLGRSPREESRRRLPYTPWIVHRTIQPHTSRRRAGTWGGR